MRYRAGGCGEFLEKTNNELYGYRNANDVHKECGGGLNGKQRERVPRSTLTEPVSESTLSRDGFSTKTAGSYDCGGSHSAWWMSGVLVPSLDVMIFSCSPK